MKNRDFYWRKYKIQDTLYIGQWHLSHLQSKHLGTSHSSPSRHQLLHRISPNLTDGLKSLPFQRWFYFWEQREVTGHQIWAVVGLSHLGDLMFCQNTLHEMWCMSCDEAANHQLPITAALLNHLNSFHKEMFKLNAKLDSDSLLHLLSHFECDGHTVHMLTQWHLPPLVTSTVKSSLFTHVHSRPLPLTTKLYRCCANYSCCIKNGWTFFRQTSVYFIVCSISIMWKLCPFPVNNELTLISTSDNRWGVFDTID